MERIAVVGAGIMGYGIAQVAAMAKFKVFLRDIDEAILKEALAKIIGSLTRYVRKGSLTQKEVDEIMERITPTTDLKKAVEEADYIIEAVPEILSLKRELFSEIDRYAPSHCILSTNTSQYRITAIATATKRRDKVIGTHFFNPPVMRHLVEIIKGLETSEETLAVTKDLCSRLEMEIVVCQKDSAGFITTRLISLWLNEAQRIYEEGIASKEDIDKACRIAFGHPMGPFEIFDLSGLDTVLHIMSALAENYGERFKPNQTLINLVESGYMGKKTGRGFYIYDTKGKS